MSLQLVDSDGHLQPEKKLTEFLSSLVSHSATASPGATDDDILRRVGVNYHVIGVFGGQSSGKSTLLNHLFGTDFQTLDESQRRGQTTKGAFIAQANSNLEGFEQLPDSARPAAPSTQSTTPPGQSTRQQAAAAAAAASDSNRSPLSKEPLLVVDFEGTDGLERGEDQSFERQLSLFGLSLADTLIINMWAVDVGRFNAANLSLLRTIFEVNLQLFSHDSYEEDEKPTLLIVLRDFTEEDAGPSLTTVRKSFDTIWESINRPPKYASAPIDALFHLKYYVMPHYKLQKPEFMARVTELRRWFGDSTYKNYLFRRKAMFRGVPMDALPSYLTNCWEAIRTSKDLDIPTQREMLAQHRCKDVKEQELKAFLSFCRHYEDRINRGEMLLRLSEVLDEELEQRLTAYFAQTKLYKSEVVSDYAQHLESDMVDAMMKVVNRFSKAVAAEVMSSMESRVQAVVDDCVQRLLKDAQSLKFSSAVEEEQDTVDSVEDGAVVPKSVSYSRYVMDNAGCRQLVKAFWKNLRRQLNDILGEMSANPPPAHLYGRYTTLVAQDTTARGNVTNVVMEAIFAKVRARLTSMSENTCDAMHHGFEQCLTHNPDGTIKFFSTTKGLERAVPTAQQAGMVLLGCLLYFRLELTPASSDSDDEQAEASALSMRRRSRSERRVDRDRRAIAVRESRYEREFFLDFTTIDSPPKYPAQVAIAPAPADGQPEDPSSGVCADCVLLSQSAVLRAFELYRQKCDFTTQLQMRSIEAGKQRLPAWVIPALLILGWNEMYYVVSSPTLLVLLIVVVFFFFKNFIIAQYQAFVETGPPAMVIPVQATVTYVSQFVQALTVEEGGAAAPGSATGSSATPPPQTPAETPPAAQPARTASPQPAPGASPATEPTPTKHYDVSDPSSKEPRTMRHRAARKEA